MRAPAYVGVDVAKRSFDVPVRPQDHLWKLPYTGSGTCMALLRFGRKRVVGTEMPVVAFVVGDGESV